MSASLGPSLVLRSNASPRCLTGYISKSKSNTNSSSAGNDPSNPFDDNPTSSSSSSSDIVYSVAFGTERGSLHFRTYTIDITSAATQGDDASQLLIDAETTIPDGLINLQGAVKGAIVGITLATRCIVGVTQQQQQLQHQQLVLSDGTNSNLTSPPIFLLLVDDNRGSTTTSATDSNSGTYAAHLVIVKNGSFHKLPPAPSSSGGGDGLLDGTANHSNATTTTTPMDKTPSHKRGGSTGGFVGSTSSSGWFGESSNTSNSMGMSTPKNSMLATPGNIASNNNATTTASSSSLGSLPRMSCATYHPHTGFVYAAGTGVYGLPPQAVKAVLAGMTTMMNDTLSSGGRGGGSSSSSTYYRRGHGGQGGSGGGGGTNAAGLSTSSIMKPPIALYLKCNHVLPPPGVRGGSKNAMTLACSGRVAIVAVTNTFYAVPAFLDVNVLRNQEPATANIAAASSLMASLPSVSATKLLSFAQSSQVHPVIAIEVLSSNDGSTASSASSGDVMRYLRSVTSLVVLASGRECTTVDIESIPDANAVSTIEKGGTVLGGMVRTAIHSSACRHGIATLPSPIVAAASLTGGSGVGDISSGPLVSLLTADGLVHIRSPLCIAVPLTTIEVGTRPNDYFSLSPLPSLLKYGGGKKTMLATSYGGEARLVCCQAESPQVFADRFIKLSIDAFGPNGFPRLELANSIGSTFSATSYVGPEPTAHKRSLLQQYLEVVLGLADDVRRGGGRLSSMASENIQIYVNQEGGMEVEVNEPNQEHELQAASSSLGPNALLTCTALLCLVCFQVNPPNATLACRASKACASAMGIRRRGDTSVAKSAVTVCELIADRLLKEAAAASFSRLSPSPISPSNRHAPSGASMQFVESAVWLLRSCGCHEKAIFVLEERMNDPALRNASVAGDGQIGNGFAFGWSQIKFDSYIATHLGDLWSSKDEKYCQLVIQSSATRDLLARNPSLGLSIFTSTHPQNENEWRKMKPGDDPLAHPFYPSKVTELLKLVSPHATSKELLEKVSNDASGSPPLHSGGRALAVAYLESALGISSGRPTESQSDPSYRGEFDERKADMHDELSYLLLEGVISERVDGESSEDSDLGALYRLKLRRLLSWPNSMMRSERLLTSLPTSFLREHALLLGRLGRHEDALRIFYCDLSSMELALEYCDIRHERKEEEGRKVRSTTPSECAYIPLVKVALNADSDPDRGVAAAIQVLALRRNVIDKSAALRLLPKNVPLSEMTRPFLIPAVVENQSQVRRLSVASALLRSRYMQLKKKLTEAQLKSQASLHTVPALQKLNLGEHLHSSKPTKARLVHPASSPNFPEVLLVKHFFSRHLVIQAQVMNVNISQAYQDDVRTLTGVAFVVAESSDEALLPTLQVSLKTLPPRATGSAWCVLAASPQRLDGTAFLASELRFTVLEVDAAGAPLTFVEANAPGYGRPFVEELQDLEIRHTEFSRGKTI
eukprot:scaffold1984_cov113-Skeletonema_marinoi.AAC.2